MFDIILIFLAFAFVHSITVTTWFKEVCRRTFDGAVLRVWYRFLFTVLSILTAAIAFHAIRQVPDHHLWTAPPSLQWPLQAIRFSAVVFAAFAFRYLDGMEFLGLRQVWRYLSKGEVSGNIEGLTERELVTTGVYGIVRHPLYVAGIVFFTFTPRITVNGIIVTVLADIYFLFGMFIEERRYEKLFGERYRQYQQSVPMFLPRWFPMLRRGDALTPLPGGPGAVVSSPAPDTDAPASMKMRRTFAGPPIALIAVLAVIAYGGTFRNGFVWDDHTVIVHNPAIHDLTQWPSYFTRADTIASDPDSRLRRVYRPLQTLSFAIDWALWEGWSGGMHVTSLLLHVAACVCIVFAFGPLVGRRAALLAAAIFAVHPALSESVLYLLARANILYTLFSLLSIGWFVRAVRPFDRQHLLSVAAACCAFFAKEPAIVLVVLLPLLQVLFERPGRLRERSSLLFHLPFLLAAAGYLVARMLVVETSHAIPYWGGSLGRTVLMQSQVFTTYLRLLVWPFSLSGRYPVQYGNPFFVLHVIANVLFIVFGLYIARRNGKGRLIASSIAWFYVSLAPVSNIIPIPGSMTGERFLYFTFAGMIPLLASAMPDPLPERIRKPALAAAVCLLAAFIAKDIDRTAVWRSDASFFGVLAKQEPDDPQIQILMAKAEVLAGDPEPAVRRMAPIIYRITAFSPLDKAAAHFWYGRALLDTGRHLEAFHELAMVVGLTGSLPSEVVPYLAEAAALSGKLDTARAVLTRELERAPNNDILWNSLGNVLGMRGDLQGAVAAYQRAITINPNNREAAVNLQRARQAAGR